MGSRDDILADIDRMRGRATDRRRESRPPVLVGTVRNRTGIAMIVAVLTFAALLFWGLAKLAILAGAGIFHFILPSHSFAKALLGIF